MAHGLYPSVKKFSRFKLLRQDGCFIFRTIIIPPERCPDFQVQINLDKTTPIDRRICTLPLESVGQLLLANVGHSIVELPKPSQCVQCQAHAEYHQNCVLRIRCRLQHDNASNKKHSILASSALYGEVKCCAVFYHATARAE